MAHFQMDSEGLNSKSIVTWKLCKDGVRISFGKDYVNTFKLVNTIAADTDTFSDYEGGNPRWSMLQARAWAAGPKARFEKGAK